MDSRRGARALMRTLFFSTSFLLLACTKTCVGFPELGSKQRPVRFYVDGWNRKEESVEAFKRFSACVEAASGYRVAFEIAADEKAVASALARGDIHFGTMSALGYVESKARAPVHAVLVVSEKGAPSTRSVLLGKASRWKTSLGSLGLSLNAVGLRSDAALTPIDGRRFAYLTPESDIGFFVPRHLLLQHNVFPEEAIFTGSFPLVLQAIERDLAMAGAVSESFIESMWPNATPVQPGLPLGAFVVLAVSQGLPGKVVAARQELPERLRTSVMAGLEECTQSATRADAQRIFGGDGFIRAQEKMFEFIEELHDFQQEHVRVLSSQK